MKRAYGYIRSATDEKSHLQLQTMRIADYCKKNNLELVDTFADVAASRMTMLDQMFSRCRRKDKIVAIIVTSKDRLSRDDFELCIFEGLLKKKGIVLIALNDL